MPESSLFLAAALGFVGDHRLVVEVHRHGQDVADLVRALIFEEGARAFRHSELGL